MVVQVRAKHKDLLTSRELGNTRKLPEKETITVLSAHIIYYISIFAQNIPIYIVCSVMCVMQVLVVSLILY